MKVLLCAALVAAVCAVGAKADSFGRISSYGAVCETHSIIMVCQVGSITISYSHDYLRIGQHLPGPGTASKPLFLKQLLYDNGVENTDNVVVPAHSIYQYGVLCSATAAGVMCQLIDHSWLHFTMTTKKVVVLNKAGAVMFSKVLP
jgi:hypothetical protein